MPTPAESLTITSSKQERQQAVSECISQLVSEGTSQDQAVAICTSQADRAQGTKENPVTSSLR